MSDPLEQRVQEALSSPEADPEQLKDLCQQLLQERSKTQARLDRIVRLSDGYQSQLQDANRVLSESNERLTTALGEVKTLQGFIPICRGCKKIRDDKGFWDDVEQYLGKNSEAVLSQSVCPTCLQSEMTTLSIPRPLRRVRSRDDDWRRLDDLLASGIKRDNPLLGPHLELSKRFAKIARRLDKISKMSDGYQAQLQQLNQTLQRASFTDPLTGIANRRAMLERLKAESNRASRGDPAFCVLMVDLDHFKNVNDTYGHEAGDLIILAVAKTLENSVRNFDLCARWGGEEFLVLLTRTDLETASGVAEKLLQAVRAHEISYEGQTLTITFSGGLALHQSQGDVNETLREADRALYEAKTGGRNRVKRA